MAEAIYCRVTRYAKPAGWTNNSTASVSRLGKIAGHYIGPNTLQKVMAGDQVSATAQYYYAAAFTNTNPNIIPSILSSLASAISGNATSGTLAHGNSTAITTQLNGAPAFTTAVEPSGATGNVPQAYLTILFFDERFNLVAAADGGVAQQAVATTWSTSTAPLGLTNIKAPKNGYAYVYVSNRSDQDVYFDNLVVNVNAGNIIEENHYYAFGLKIAGISSKKLGDGNEGNLQNNYLYQALFSENDADIGWEDFALRNYDPQIGRWVQYDPYNEFASPYIGMGNIPHINIDPDGGSIFSDISEVSFAGKIAMGAIAGGVAGMALDEAFGGDGGKGGLIGAIAGALLPGLSEITVRVAISMGIDAVNLAANDLKINLNTQQAGTATINLEILESSQNVAFSNVGTKVPIFPSFSKLQSNYPLPYSTRPDVTPTISGKPVNAVTGENYLYYNQCAIRMSIALKKSGVKLTQVQNVTNPGSSPYSAKKDVVGARNLAVYLRKFGKPKVYNGTETDVRKSINGITGIIYFENFEESGAASHSNTHIELWNKDHYQSSYPFSQMFKATVIWFWEIK